MPKRKASEIVDDTAEAVGTNRRSSRRTAPPPKEESPQRPPKSKKTSSKSKATKQKAPTLTEANGTAAKKVASKKPSNASKIAKSEENGESTGQQYWLMKAEPETRMEKGKDVKFSIDDLASKTEPEPWDGIRNYVARNNLRAMKKGDMAFFYHSNCKVPGIVGMMEIVEEHSPDLTARDPSAPYYDPKDKGEEPRWSVVHVEFRQKFDQQITLPELKEWNKKGEPLENMQMLNSARLSVSKVSKEEWEFLMGVVEERKAAAGSDEA